MTTTLYFSNCSLILSGGGVVPPGRKVPQEAIEALEKSGELDVLLAKRSIINRLPLAGLEPKTISTERVEHADWRFEEKDLLDKPLEALNMMIQGHVEKNGLAAVEPFATREEAIYWMSKDLPPKA